MPTFLCEGLRREVYSRPRSLIPLLLDFLYRELVPVLLAELRRFRLVRQNRGTRRSDDDALDFRAKNPNISPVNNQYTMRALRTHAPSRSSACRRCPAQRA